MKRIESKISRLFQSTIADRSHLADLFVQQEKLILANDSAAVAALAESIALQTQKVSRSSYLLSAAQIELAKANRRGLHTPFQFLLPLANGSRAQLEKLFSESNAMLERVRKQSKITHRLIDFHSDPRIAQSGCPFP